MLRGNIQQEKRKNRVNKTDTKIMSKQETEIQTLKFKLHIAFKKLKEIKEWFERHGNNIEIYNGSVMLGLNDYSKVTMDEYNGTQQKTTTAIDHELIEKVKGVAHSDIDKSIQSLQTAFKKRKVAAEFVLSENNKDAVALFSYFNDTIRKVLYL